MKKCNGVIKKILRDHFEGFWAGNKIKFPEKVREHLYDDVQKMMNCGDFSLGFVAYVCLICLEKLKIGFSCKSQMFKTSDSCNAIRINSTFLLNNKIAFKINNKLLQNNMCCVKINLSIKIIKQRYLTL